MKGFSDAKENYYTEEMLNQVLDVLSTSTDSLEVICANNTNFPSAKLINYWRIRDTAFGDRYMQAKRIQADLLAEQLIDIAKDDARDFYTDEEGLTKLNHLNFARAKLKSENIKWLASKLIPKTYGDRISQDTTVHIKQECAIDELE